MKFGTVFLVLFIFFALMTLFLFYRPIQKQIIEEPNLHSSNSCFVSALDKDCLCPLGYSKKRDVDTYGCFPTICGAIDEYDMVGDVGIYYGAYCEAAVRNLDVSICDFINSKRGRDICILAYVGRTDDVSVCQKISNFLMRRECYD